MNNQASLQATKKQQQFLRAVQEHQLPKSYAASIFKAVRKHQQTLIEEEIRNIERGQSLPQLIDLILADREQVLKTLRRKVVENRSAEMHINIAEVFDLLTRVRELSLAVVERIAELRGKYMLDGEEELFGAEVIRKISADVDFLRTSPLRKYLEFNSNDPLFTYSLKKFWNLSLATNYNNRSVINFFELEGDFRDRIMAADEFIRAKNNKNKEKNKEKKQESHDNVTIKKPKKEQQDNHILFPAINGRGRRVKTTSDQYSLQEVKFGKVLKSNLKTISTTNQKSKMKKKQINISLAKVNKQERNYSMIYPSAENLERAIKNRPEPRVSLEEKGIMEPIFLSREYYRQPVVRRAAGTVNIERYVDKSQQYEEEKKMKEPVHLFGGRTRVNQFVVSSEEGVGERHGMGTGRKGEPSMRAEKGENTEKEDKGDKKIGEKEIERSLGNKQKRDEPVRDNILVSKVRLDSHKQLESGKSQGIYRQANQPQIKRQKYTDIKQPSHNGDEPLKQQKPTVKIIDQQSAAKVVERQPQLKTVENRREAEQRPVVRVIEQPRETQRQPRGSITELPKGIEQRLGIKVTVDRQDTTPKVVDDPKSIQQPKLIGQPKVIEQPNRIEQPKLPAQQLPTKPADNQQNTVKAVEQLKQTQQQKIVQQPVFKVADAPKNSEQQQPVTKRVDQHKPTIKVLEDQPRATKNVDEQKQVTAGVIDQQQNAAKDANQQQRQQTVKVVEQPKLTDQPKLVQQHPSAKTVEPIAIQHAGSQQPAVNVLQQQQPTVKVIEQRDQPQTAVKGGEQPKTVGQQQGVKIVEQQRPVIKVVQQPKASEHKVVDQQQQPVKAPQHPRIVQQSKTMQQPKIIEQPKSIEQPKTIQKPKAIHQPKIVEEPKLVDQQPKVQVVQQQQSPIKLVGPPQTSTAKIQEPPTKFVQPPPKKIQPVFQPPPKVLESKPAGKTGEQPQPSVKNSGPLKPQDQSALKPELNQPNTSENKLKISFRVKNFTQNEFIQSAKTLFKVDQARLREASLDNYFSGRHLCLLVALVNEKPAAAILSHPLITQNNRSMLIPMLCGSAQLQQPTRGIVLASALRYIFMTDPSQYIYLNLKQASKATCESHCQQFYAGQTQLSISARMPAQSVHVFDRREYQCKNQEEYYNILNFEFTLVCRAQPPKELHSEDYYFSPLYLQRLASGQELKFQQFSTPQQMNENLAKLELQPLKTETKGQVKCCTLTSVQVFKNLRYYVYQNLMHIKVEPPYTYYAEIGDYFYFLIKSESANLYYLISDTMYDDDQSVPNSKSVKALHKHFTDKVGGRTLQSTFKPSNKETIVRMPLFSKCVTVGLPDGGSFRLEFELLWREYLRGVRYEESEDLFVETMSPFFFGLVQVDTQGRVGLNFVVKVLSQDEATA